HPESKPWRHKGTAGVEPEDARRPFNRAVRRKIKGGIGMMKIGMVPENPPPNYTLNIAINSIVAAAKTAHDLESARRKATRDKPAGNGRGEDSDVQAWGVRQRDR